MTPDEPLMESSTRSYGDFVIATVGDQSWQSTDNSFFSDGRFMEITLDSMSQSDAVLLSDFKFQIPDGATIQGIEVEIDGFASGNGIADVLLSLSVGNNESINLGGSPLFGQEWQTEQSTWSYGSSFYLWDLQWTPEMLNAEDFSVNLQVANISDTTIEAFVDRLSVKVSYTPLYTACDHNCLIFYINENPSIDSYTWTYPSDFHLLSSTDTEHDISIGQDEITQGTYEVCVESLISTNVVEECCRTFVIDNCATSSIGDFVWEDINYNGLQDTDELGLVGVVMELYDDQNNLIATSTTDSLGKYSFEEVEKGYYTVRTSSLSSEYLHTLSDVGMDDLLDNDFTSVGNIFTSDEFYLDPDIEKDDVDLGVYRSVSISGQAFEDMAYDGQRNVQDPLLSGLEVYLTDEVGDTIAITMTDISGAYSFDMLTPGIYSVLFNIDDFEVTLQDIGDDSSDNDFAQDASVGPFTLGSGDHMTSLDIGLFMRVSLGDFVFIDIDRDGIQSDADEAFGEIWIRIFRDDGSGMIEIESNTDGTFCFDNLLPGSYFIELLLDAEVYMVTDLEVGDPETDSNAIMDGDRFLSQTVFIPSGTDFKSLDIGVQFLPSSISGFAWLDKNADGILQNEEERLSGISIMLVNMMTNNTTVVDTDEDGNYIFDNLDAGQYFIKFGFDDDQIATIPDNASEDIDSDILDSFGAFTTAMIDVGVDDQITDITGAYYELASIGDFVWLDENLNGIQDGDELGLDGVKIDLLDQDGNILSSTESSDGGQYIFDDLLPSMYQLVINYPDGFDSTLGNASADNTLDSDITITNGVGRTSIFELCSGEQNNTIDLGLVDMRSNISGLVFIDDDGNGIRDNDELLLEGVQVELLDASDNVVALLMTDMDGAYLFDDLSPGQYMVKMIIDGQYEITTANVGLNDIVDSDFTIDGNMVVSEELILNPLNEITNLDLGVYELVSIGDQVWLDENENGLRDLGEIGIEGITIELVHSSGSIIATTSTDTDGIYLFEDYAPGLYQIRVTSGDEYSFTMANQGADDTIDSDVSIIMSLFGFTDQTLIRSGIEFLNLDVGLVQENQSTIIGTVWNDINRNGLFDMTEFPVEDVLVQLFDVDGNNISNMMTDSQGHYMFVQLPAGDYYIQITLPDNFELTIADAGDDTIDSDITGGNGLLTSDIISVSAGETVENIDAGLIAVGSSSIAGLAWRDSDLNGLRDNNEIFLSNVSVTLKNNAGVILASTLTDISGAYKFENLVAGLYNVEFDDPFGFGFTIPNAGDDSIDSDVVGNEVTNVFLFLDTDLTGVDAGFAVPAMSSISGSVWFDDNRDGLNNNMEPAADPVTITLFNMDNELIMNTISAIDGTYEFNDILGGSYYIVFGDIENYTFTAPLVGVDHTIDSDVIQNIAPGSTFQIALSGQDSVFDIDAGYILQANGSIAGVVLEDLKVDGIQDADDSPIEGIEINLLNSNDVVVATTTSASDGRYLFDNLVPGDYYLVVDKTMDYLLSMANVGTDDQLDFDITESISASSTDLISLAINESIDDIDVGLYRLASIAGVYFFDTNQNGLIDPADAIVPDAVVELRDASGATVASTSTSNLGTYIFEDLMIQDYIVAFAFDSNQEFTIANTSMDDLIDSDVISVDGSFGVTGILSAMSGMQFVGVNAGVKEAAQFIDISGVAWEDIDGDGERESGDPLLAGYEVSLFDASDMLISTTTTDNNGQYSFTNLPKMDYYVVFELPTNQGFTFENTTADNIDSDVLLTGITGATDLVNVSISTLDAGYYRFASIGDQVFNDFNVNGINDITEQGINSIRVRLFDATNTQIATRFTSTDNATGRMGVYNFGGLRPGNYYVRFDPAGGLFFTDPNIGGDDTIDSDVNSSNGFGTTPMYTLTSGEVETSVDAGLLQDPAYIGDYCWVDINGNGVQDGQEPGLDGVTIELFSIDGDLITTTTSGPDPVTLESGFYEFANVQPGAYYLVFTPPSDYLFTDPDQGGNDSQDSDITSVIEPGATNIVNLASGESDTDIDGGFFIPAGLGDFVWNDLNENGIQDAGEPGIAGVAVDLRATNGSVIASTTTDANGMYNFGGLTQGVYFVSFTAPTGFMFTTANAGNDDIDSDANSTGNTPLVSLAHSVNFQDLDAGLVEASSLVGSRVWLDFNRDGIQTFNEEGIENIVVNLKNMSGATVASTITDFDGEYRFFNIAPGDYQVQFVPIDNLMLTVQNNGTDDNLDSDADITGLSNMFSLSNGDYNMHVDAGMFPVNGISGLVYEDMNASNSYDINEFMMPDVMVELWNMNDTKIDEMMTSDNGAYVFENISSGTYRLRFLLEDHYLTADPNMDEMSPGYFETEITFNNLYSYEKFGFYPGTDIEGRMWMDIDADASIDDNEHYLTDITAELYNNKGDLVASQKSNDLEHLSFTKVPAGRYYMKFDIDGDFAGQLSYTRSTESKVTERFGYGTTDYFDVKPSYEILQVDAGVMPIYDLEVDFAGDRRESHHYFDWDVDPDCIVTLERSNDDDFEAIIEDRPSYDSYQDYDLHTAGDYIYRLAMMNGQGLLLYSTELGFETQDDQDFIVNIMPNPIVDEASIRIQSSKESPVAIQLYDQSGRVVQHLAPREINLGENIIELNANELSEGIYMLSIQFEYQRIIKQVIVTK